MEKILEKIYLFIISKDFPLWLAIIFLFGFIIDLTHTMQILYNDKPYFLLYESNGLLKYSLSSENWFVYSAFAFGLYFTMIYISKSYPNVALRSLFLVLGLLQLGTPIAWKISPNAFGIFYLLIFVCIYYPVIHCNPKIKNSGTPKGA